MLKKTRFKKKTMFCNRDCPPKGKSWTDIDGKLHLGLLRRYINKARRRGFERIIFYSFKNDLRTIIDLKPKPLKRTK